MKKIWFRYSKLWWNKNCQRELEKYRVSKQVKDWIIFKSIIKKTKCAFFDTKIQEIAEKTVVLGNL